VRGENAVLAAAILGISLWYFYDIYFDEGRGSIYATARVLEKVTGRDGLVERLEMYGVL
jgi:hypothetical protein